MAGNTYADMSKKTQPAPVPRNRTSHAVVDNAERYGLIVAWLLIIVVFGYLKPQTFLTWPNFSTIFGSQAVLVVITLGLIIPLTANDFDVSIAYVMTLSSMLIAVLNVQLGVPIGWAILVALGVGLLVGVEFVKDKATREPYPKSDNIAEKVRQACLEENVLTYPTQGCVDGLRGDHILLAPPFTISPDESALISGALQSALARIF